MGLKTKIIAGVLAASVGITATGIIAPLSMSEDFPYYKRTSRWDIHWYDYSYDDLSPSAGNKPTAYPTYYKNYPHRAIFFGARSTTEPYSEQSYNSHFYVVYSKTPYLDKFDFTYVPSSESGSKKGSILADFKRGYDDGTFGPHSEFDLLFRSWHGVSPGAVRLQATLFGQLTAFVSPNVVLASEFYFDFYYQCCGDLQIEGLRNITDVPYGYIVNCVNSGGTGGGSQSGSSSTGSGGSGSSGSGGSGSSGSGSSGSGSSGGGSSSGGSSGSGSSGSGSSGSGSSGSGSSKEPWEEEGSYPWEDDDNIPTLRPPKPPPPFVNDGEDGEGENGDTWTIPEWGIPPLPFTEDDFNIPPFPGNLEESYPDFPIDLEESYPDFPGNFEESYPDPYFPDDWSWPPPPPIGTPPTRISSFYQQERRKGDRKCIF